MKKKTSDAGTTQGTSENLTLGNTNYIKSGISGKTTIPCSNELYSKPKTAAPFSRTTSTWLPNNRKPSSKQFNKGTKFQTDGTNPKTQRRLEGLGKISQSTTTAGIMPKRFKSDPNLQLDMISADGQFDYMSNHDQDPHGQDLPENYPVKFNLTQNFEKKSKGSKSANRSLGYNNN